METINRKKYIQLQTKLTTFFPSLCSHTPSHISRNNDLGAVVLILFYGFVSDPDLPIGVRGRPRVWSRLSTIRERARRKILESKPLPLPLNPAIAPLRRWGDVDAAAPV